MNLVATWEDLDTGTKHLLDLSFCTGASLTKDGLLTLRFVDQREMVFNINTNLGKLIHDNLKIQKGVKLNAF